MKTAFEVPNGGIHAYDAELLIVNASNGNKYLYDVQKIKRNSTISASLAQRATVKRDRTASVSVIAEDSETVKKTSSQGKSVLNAPNLIICEKFGSLECS